jgi:hypothetical protein
MPAAASANANRACKQGVPTMKSSAHHLTQTASALNTPSVPKHRHWHRIVCATLLCCGLGLANGQEAMSDLLSVYGEEHDSPNVSTGSAMQLADTGDLNATMEPTAAGLALMNAENFGSCGLGQ